MRREYTETTRRCPLHTTRSRPAAEMPTVIRRPRRMPLRVSRDWTWPSRHPTESAFRSSASTPVTQDRLAEGGASGHRGPANARRRKAAIRWVLRWSRPPIAPYTHDWRTQLESSGHVQRPTPVRGWARRSVTRCVVSGARRVLARHVAQEGRYQPRGRPATSTRRTSTKHAVSKGFDTLTVPLPFLVDTRRKEAAQRVRWRV